MVESLGFEFVKEDKDGTKRYKMDVIRYPEYYMELYVSDKNISMFEIPYNENEKIRTIFTIINITHFHHLYLLLSHLHHYIGIRPA